MNAPTPPLAEHQDIWEMIPWFVNGRLGESDCRRAEAHLRHCAACQDEVISQRRIQQSMRADAGVEQLPMAGLNRLRQRIEAFEAAAARPEPQSSAGTARFGARRSLRRYSLAASMVAMTVTLGILGSLAWHRAERGGSPAPYFTVTTPTPQAANATIRAVFAPAVTLSDLQTMLGDAQLRIVSGPTEAGVYTLAATGSQSVTWSLRRLRGHEAVRFAETIERSSDAAPPP